MSVSEQGHPPLGAAAGGRVPFRLAMIGWGAISQRVVDLLNARNHRAVQLVAIGLRETTGRLIPSDVPVITDPDALGAFDADLVVEAAGREAVSIWGAAALRSAPGFVVTSTSALCDDELQERLLGIAAAHGSQLIVPSGALAGIDGVVAAAMLDLDSVTHTITKPAAAWRQTAAEQLVDLDSLRGPATFFSGPAREAANRFPQNANSAVITAMAGVGLDRTIVELVADPDAVRNQHRIRASGAFGALDVLVENRPLAANPKSSEMTALGLVRLVEDRFRTLVR